MINRIRVKNFQSLGDVDLALGQFTALVGPSDIGKSALLRALRAVVTNPAGTDVIRNGSKQAKVAIDIEDPEGRTSVVWEKGASASYSVVDADEATVGTYEFDKVRPSNVPDEVRAALRLGAMSLAGMDLDPNYHAQHEPPFLLAAPPSARSRLLGEVTGAAILMAAVSDAKKADAMAKREQTVRQADKEAAEVKLREYHYLVDSRRALDAVSAEAEWLKAAKEESLSIRGAISGLRDHEENLTMAEMAATRLRAGLETMEGFCRDLTLRAEVFTELGEQLRRLGEAEELFLSASRDHERIASDLAELRQQVEAIPRCPQCGQELPR